MRKKQVKADIPKLQSIIDQPHIDLRPLVASVMKASGCTYQEIGDVMQLSRQSAENLVKKAQNDR